MWIIHSQWLVVVDDQPHLCSYTQTYAQKPYASESESQRWKVEDNHKNRHQARKGRLRHLYQATRQGRLCAGVRRGGALSSALRANFRRLFPSCALSPDRPCLAYVRSLRWCNMASFSHPEVPVIGASDDFDVVVAKLARYITRAITTSHSFEELRTTRYPQSLQPLVTYLAEDVHHPATVHALL
jgi:hypothetical protein